MAFFPMPSLYPCSTMKIPRRRSTPTKRIVQRYFLPLFLMLCTYPVAADPTGLFSTHEDLGGGWRYSEWFGYVNDTVDPWMFQAEHGWIYTVGDSLDNIRFWSDSLNWLWTGSGLYPFLYSLFTAEPFRSFQVLETV